MFHALQARQRPQGADGGDDEVLAAAALDVAAQGRDHARRIALDDVAHLAAGGAGDGIGLAAQAERVAVVAPLRLDDLELARDRGLQADEEQPAVCAVVTSQIGPVSPARARVSASALVEPMLSNAASW